MHLPPGVYPPINEIINRIPNATAAAAAKAIRNRNRFSSLDLLIRSTKETTYKIYGNQEEIASGSLSSSWNRVKINEKAKNLAKIMVEIEAKGEYGFGEIYFIQ